MGMDRPLQGAPRMRLPSPDPHHALAGGLSILSAPKRQVLAIEGSTLEDLWIHRIETEKPWELTQPLNLADKDFGVNEKK